MKKLGSLLAVFVLSLMMVVPAFAVNPDYNGVVLPALPDAEYPHFFVRVYDGIYTLYAAEKYSFYVKNIGTDPYLHFSEDLMVQVWTYNPSRDSGWVLSPATGEAKAGFSCSNVFWSSNSLYWEDGTLFLAGSAPTYPTCDGTSCSATDVNFDDICDDCGYPLAYELRVNPNTFSTVVKHSDTLTLKYSYTETLADTMFDAVYANDRITISFDNPVNHYQYKYVDGEWVEYASYPNQYGSHVISLSNGSTIQSSDLNVYDENGELFFQNPLWMEMEKVTQGEMMGMVQEMGGTMKTLVVCGVGLMACLMALSLFGKRWLIFLR